MRFGTWNVRSLYREGSLTAVARELAKYKLGLVGRENIFKPIIGNESLHQVVMIMVLD
jgi:hypothetical protein